MKCKVCGLEHDQEARFCTGCGSKINEPKSKGHRSLWIILGSILAFLLIAGVLVFAFRWQLLQAVSPKTFVSLALANTGRNTNAELKKTWLPQLNQGDQTAGDWTIILGEEDEGNKFQFDWQYDRPGQQFLSTINYFNPWIDPITYKIYLSPEQLLLRTQGLEESDYVFVNVDTFTQDWNKSVMGKDNNAPDIELLLEAMFGGKDIEVSPDQIKQQAELVAAWQEMDKAMVFQGAGQVSLDLAGESQNLLAVDCRIPKEAATAFFQRVVSVYKDQMQYTDIIGGNQWNLLDEMNLQSISFDSDLSIRYLMDNHALVRQISLAPTMIKSEEREEASSVGFTMTLAGKEQVLDDMRLDIDTQSPDSPKNTFSLLRKVDLTSEGHYRQTFSVKNNEDSQMELSQIWESTGEKEGEFTISLSLIDYFSDEMSERMSLSSTVKWEADKITFSKGTIRDVGADNLFLSFEGTQKVLLPDSIQKPDQGDGISLWEMMDQSGSSAD